MKKLKIKMQFEIIPAIGLVVGWQKSLVIMIPFVCITIERVKTIKKDKPLINSIA